MKMKSYNFYDTYTDRSGGIMLLESYTLKAWSLMVFSVSARYEFYHIYTYRSWSLIKVDSNTLRARSLMIFSIRVLQSLRHLYIHVLESHESGVSYFESLESHDIFHYWS